MTEFASLDDSDVVAEPQAVDYRRIEVVDPQMAEILRGKTVAERIAMVQQAHQTGQKLVAMGVRMQYPEWTDTQVSIEVARRMLNGTT